MAYDDDDEFDDDEFDYDDDDSEVDKTGGTFYECNCCHKIFDWKPVFYSFEGTVGVFCSDSCGKTALAEMQRLTQSNREGLIDLGVKIFKTLFE